MPEDVLAVGVRQEGSRRWCSTVEVYPPQPPRDLQTLWMRRSWLRRPAAVGRCDPDAAIVTSTTRGQLADLELRHRRRARCEDRIRIAKDTGLTNLPLHSFAANQIWCAVVALVTEITAWMQMLALHAHHARRWEPKALRFSSASSRSPRPSHAPPDA